MKTRPDCPGPEQLTQFLGASLAPDVETQISTHLSGCDACRDQLDALVAADAPFCQQDSSEHSAPVEHLLNRFDQRLRQSSGAVQPLQPGSRIAGYLLQKLLSDDQCGMGEVWLASQLNPARDVALKIIGANSLQQSRLERFEREKQAIAQLDHDRIARLYDTGVTESGRPWFAMEFVAGLHVTNFCYQASLNLQERIELFLLVCDAVQAAHFNGIVHRDLKPANILVAGDRQTPRTKLIDFGIALQESDVLANDRQTVTESVMGTFRYMSPEQASGRLDPAVNYRTDIYSLGVLLYELVCGRTPSHHFAPNQLPASQMLAIAEAADVLRPSEFVICHEPLIAEHLARLKTSAGSLAATLREDLDWIILKALERNPAARFESVQNFANDLRRYLNHEPVHSRTLTTRLYRSSKWIRKHRRTLGISGIVGTLATWLLVLILNQWWETSRRSAEQVAGSMQINQTVSTLVDEIESEMLQLLDDQRSRTGWKQLRTNTEAWDKRLQSIEASIQQAETVLTTTDYRVAENTIRRLTDLQNSYQQLASDRKNLWQNIQAIREQTMVRSSHGDVSMFKKKNNAYTELLAHSFPHGVEGLSADQIAAVLSESRTPWLWVSTLDDYAMSFTDEDSPLKHKLRRAVVKFDDNIFHNSIRNLALPADLQIAEPPSPVELRQHILQLAACDETNDLPLELLTLLQSALIAVGERETATKIIENAAWKQATDHNLWINLASAQHTPQLQLTALSAALALDPDSFVVHGKLGQCYLDAAEAEFEAGNVPPLAKLIDHSRRHLQLALQYSEPPLSAWFHHNLGLVAELQQDVKSTGNPILMIFGANKDEAIKHYQTAVTIDSGLSSSWNNLGRLLNDKHLTEEAETAYRNAISADPHQINARYNLGLLQKLASRFDEAEDAFRSLLAIDKDHLPAQSQLGELLLRRKADEEATQVFSRLRELSIQHPDHGASSPQVQFAEDALLLLKQRQSTKANASKQSPKQRPTTPLPIEN